MKRSLDALIVGGGYGLFVMFLFAACPPSAPPPEEPEPTTTVPEEPPDDPEPPPPPEPPPDDPTVPRKPEDYYPLDRVPVIQHDLFAELQANAWQGWRDPIYVLAHCPWALEPHVDAVFPMTWGQMEDFSIAGAALDQHGFVFHDRLPMVNVRCAPEHPQHDIRFCGRSDVRRERLSAFRDRLQAHLAVAGSLRDGLAEQPGYGIAYDSIKGWCEYMNRNNEPSDER